MKIRHLFALILSLGLSATLTAEDLRRELTGKTTRIETDHGSVTWKYVEDDKVQQNIGGSGGSVYRITIDNTHLNEPFAGTQVSFLVVATSGVLVEYESGMPTFEIWGRIGGGEYGYGIMKFSEGKYRSIPDSGRLFTTIQPSPDSKPVAYFPGDVEKSQPLYNPNPEDQKKANKAEMATPSKPSD